ncbi:MAG: hypothetical protein U0L11_01620 [Acutalibacteraceae bacterium]|nr:hypothetical protein [Acutalibacteraceae bacterium]
MDKIQEKRKPSKVKTIIFVSVAVVLLTAIAVIIMQFTGLFKAENNSILVYSKGNETVVRIGDIEKNITDSSASMFMCDEKSERVFYIVESAYSSNLFDLYFIEKNRSEIIGPKIIDIGIQQNYDVVDGKVYYLKRNISAGAYEGCVCDVDDNKIETFAVNVENIYPLDSDVFYYTKIHGNDRVLYKYTDSESTEVSRALVKVSCYNDTENPHIIYEKKTAANGSTTELYVAYADVGAEMICDNTAFVMYDNYEAGGNLYYFTSSEKSVSWSYVIADQYAETDPAIVKPKRDDFLAILGISSEYNEAFKEYQHKLIRDEIRAALNESVSKGEFSVPVFNAFAYNESGTHMIAQNIDPKNIYTVSVYGVPKIIFESTEVLPADTDINALVEIAQRSEMKDVIVYAKTIVSDSVKSKGMAYAACGDNGMVSCALDGYNKSNTLFSFSRNGEMIYAFVRESQGGKLNLYSNSINDNFIPAAEKIVDTGISSYYFSDDSVIYLKSDQNKTSGDIFNYNGEKSVKLSNSASAFVVKNHKDIIILKNYKSDGSLQTADFYLYSDGKEVLIGESVDVERFNCSDNGKICYITADNKLCFYYEDEPAVIDDNVNEILLLA